MPQTRKPKLLERMRQALRARHYSYRTEQSYLQWVRGFILFQGKGHPAEMGAPEIKAFLSRPAAHEHISAPLPAPLCYNSLRWRGRVAAPGGFPCPSSTSFRWAVPRTP